MDNRITQGEGVWRMRTVEQAFRVIPENDAGRVVYLEGMGTVLGVSGGDLVAKRDGAEVGRFKIRETLRVIQSGKGVSVTTPALIAILDAGIAILHLHGSGRVMGLTTPFDGRLGTNRRNQYRVLQEDVYRVEMARMVLSAKVRNQRTLLRRHGDESRARLRQMSMFARKIRVSNQIESMLGFEGGAAKLYFEGLKSRLLDTWKPHLNGRSKRPPQDRCNALLSYLYMVLVGECSTAVVKAGLDPTLGAFHGEKAGRPALALDLMEHLRPAIVDVAVLRGVNQGMFKSDDFEARDGGVFLSDTGKRKAIDCYERRLHEEVHHVVVGGKIDYRRVVDAEALGLARWFEDQTLGWSPFEIR